MKIVMVHDCAYVGYELRRELEKRNFNVQHLFLKGPPKIATVRMVVRLKRTKCDLIHAHFCRSPVYACYFSGKPYIVHCHGSDVRGGTNWLQRQCLRKAKRIVVSTPDLLEIQPNATWLPNPVDLERFKPLKEHKGNRVLYFPHWYEDVSSELKDYCERIGYDITVPRAYSVPYEQMHLFMNEYDIFVDRFSIRSYSKTALEAMACGLPVIGYGHKLEETLQKLVSYDERKKIVEWQNEHILPPHTAKAVVNKLINIYNAIR